MHCVFAFFVFRNSCNPFFLLPRSCIARYSACIAFKMTRRIKTIVDNDDDFEIQWIFIYPLFSAKVQVHRSIFALLPDFILSGCLFLSLCLYVSVFRLIFGPTALVFLRRCWYTVYFCDWRNPCPVLRLAHSFAAKWIDIPKIVPDELSHSHAIVGSYRQCGCHIKGATKAKQNNAHSDLYINGWKLGIFVTLCQMKYNCMLIRLPLFSLSFNRLYVFFLCCALWFSARSRVNSAV